MNGGRHYSSDPDGCIIEFGKICAGVFIFAIVISAIVGAWQLAFNQPTLVCKAYKTVDEIKKIPNGYNTENVLIPKQYCTEWRKP